MARKLEPGKLPPHLRWALLLNMNRVLRADDGRSFEEKEHDADRIALGFLSFIQTPQGSHLDREIMKAFQYREENPLASLGRVQ